jgi:hypothetical protein
VGPPRERGLQLDPVGTFVGTSSGSAVMLRRCVVNLSGWGLACRNANWSAPRRIGLALLRSANERQPLAGVAIGSNRVRS